MYKDVGRHKARPLQLLIIGKKMITWNFPSLFSLRSPKLGL